jgi:hypothetical protein
MTRHRIHLASRIFATVLIFATSAAVLSACAAVDSAPYTPVNADYER